MAKGADLAEKQQSDKRAAKINADNTFSAVAKACIEKNRSDGKADATVTKREGFLGIVERPLPEPALVHEPRRRRTKMQGLT